MVAWPVRLAETGTGILRRRVVEAAFHGGDDGVVLDTHLVVVLISFLQSPQDGNGAERVRLDDHDRLETAFQCLIFFEVFLILVKVCGTDAAKFSSCLWRFQDIGSIHCSFTFSGSYQSMDFVNEQNNTAFRLCHLIDNRFQTFLKFTFIFGTGYQCTHVQ